MMKAQRNMFHCYWENRPKKIRTLIAKKSIRSRPRRQHHAGGIWKPSFISPVRPSVYTNPEKLSTENRAFQKCSWKRRNKQRRHDNQVICLPESSSNTNPKWRPKWWLPCWFHHVGSTKTLLCACSRVHSSVSVACDCCVFKLLWRSEDGKHFIRFLVWTKNIWCVFKVNPPFSSHVNSHLLNWHYLHLRPELLTWRFHWSEMF